jgi:hypothetical protein
VIEVMVPDLRLHNPLNTRVHWRVLSKRGNEEKLATGFALYGLDPSAVAVFGAPSEERPWLVTITRLAPKAFDRDGMAAASKHVRDSVAKWCGVDDAFEHIVEYRYAQTKSKTYGVLIKIERKDHGK